MADSSNSGALTDQQRDTSIFITVSNQVLRRAWRAGGGQKSVFSLEDELGKPYWGTPGRYLPKKMLLALIEELGHEYVGLLDGASQNMEIMIQIFYLTRQQPILR
jgi:hypothetical protein